MTINAKGGMIFLNAFLISSDVLSSVEGIAGAEEGLSVGYPTTYTK